MHPTRLILLCAAAAALLIACAAPAVKAPPPNASPEAKAEAPAAPAVLPPPATPQQAQKLAVAAADLLETGNEEQAKAELQRVLAGDPNNKLAQNLLRQITADPVATLGRESFAYTVRATDTLSRIAGRFLGDIYSFYILARYNDIKVPRQLSDGQVIRIPGKAPPPGTLEADPRRTDKPGTGTSAATAAASPAPSAADKALASADAAEKRGDLERAYSDYRLATGGELSNSAQAKAEGLRRRLVQRHTLTARSAFAKQDLDGAIRHWDRVIQLDPGNDTARLEQQKATALKEKIKSLK